MSHEPQTKQRSSVCQVLDSDLAERTKPGSPFSFRAVVALWQPCGSLSQDVVVGQAPLQSKEETPRESSVCLDAPLRPALFTEGRLGEVCASTPLLAQFCIQRKLSFVKSLMQDLMSCDLLILEGISLSGSIRVWLLLQVDYASWCGP